MKFENRVKDKTSFFIKQNIAFFFKQKYILFLETYFYKIPKNLIAPAIFLFLFCFFLLRQIVKNIDMPRQKPRMLDWQNLLTEYH